MKEEKMVKKAIIGRTLAAIIMLIIGTGFCENAEASSDPVLPVPVAEVNDMIGGPEEVAGIANPEAEGPRRILGNGAGRRSGLEPSNLVDKNRGQGGR